MKIQFNIRFNERTKKIIDDLSCMEMRSRNEIIEDAVYFYDYAIRKHCVYQPVYKESSLTA
jgi:hypothetical protein